MSNRLLHPRILALVLTTGLAAGVASAPNAPTLSDPPSTSPMAQANPGTTDTLTLVPSTGPVGSLVTITGTGLGSATKVMFNPNVEAPFTVMDENTIKTSVPTGAKTGPVTAMTPSGSAVSNGPFTITETP